ncbi:MAG: hypothetical protein ACXABY_22840, partial [Candidatus Thorarchaeota archaeon]
SLSNASKNLVDGLQVNFQDDGVSSAVMPFMNRFTEKASIPPILQHMVEDEDEDDLGYGSGRRFVLKDSMYSKLTITETPPPYTLVQVNGLFGEGFVDPPGKLSTTSDGNAVVSAYAVDYDMWYMYGFRSTNSISAPFFSDPDSQCAPYAVFNLLQARKNILQGSVEVNVYNEFYQPGDVVYIEDRDLLFYVTEVTHNFSYGSLATTLTLKFGHNPGEYIPTMLDIVGKILYNAQGFSGQFRSSRFDSKDGDHALGAIIAEGSTLEELIAGRRGESNRKILSNILFAASGALNPVSFRRKKPVVELRYYTPGSSDERMARVAEEIQRFLTNPSEFSALTEELMGQPMGDKEAFKMPTPNVIITPVDITSAAGTGPSRSAWTSVRLLESQGVIATETVQLLTDEGQQTTDIPVGDAETLDRLMTDYILDIFLTFQTVDETKEPGVSNNQATQEINEDIEQANIRGGRAVGQPEPYSE